MSRAYTDSGNVAVLRARKSPRNPAGPFADLTWEQQRAAEQWLFKFCQRWGNDLPGWRRAILIGVAKRLAKNPPDIKFGRRLFSSRCGHALARQVRLKGIPHPGIAAMNGNKLRLRIEA